MLKRGSENLTSHLTVFCAIFSWRCRWFCHSTRFILFLTSEYSTDICCDATLKSFLAYLIIFSAILFYFPVYFYHISTSITLLLFPPITFITVHFLFPLHYINNLSNLFRNMINYPDSLIWILRTSRIKVDYPTTVKIP